MNANQLVNVAGAIVTVALVTTVVRSKNTAPVISAIGNAFSGAISAAMGRGVSY